MNISTRPTLNSIVVKLAASVVLVASLGLFSTSSEAATLIPVDNPGFVYTAVSGTRTGETEPIDTFTEGFGAGVPLIDSSAPPNSDCTLGGCVQDGTADVRGWTGTPSSFVGAENLPADQALYESRVASVSERSRSWRDIQSLHQSPTQPGAADSSRT